MYEVEIKDALPRKRPIPVTLASCIDKDGKPNIITLGWEMQTSIKPVMFAISIGYPRYSYECIKDTGEFVVAYPTEDQTDASVFCGTKSGREFDKFSETGLEALPAKHVKPPLIGGCLANFECRVVHEYETGDHAIFVGECVAAHVSEEKKGRLYILEDILDLGGISIKR
ncbi:MAG: flavin reductase family protein [Planctomycetota bacterium]|jgi:flavin reductase (DIM6/NTAB) family NADH-FMN oxidoreductase RutF